MCRLNGIETFVNRNPSSLGVVAPRTMADTIEAIVGAVYLDSLDFAAIRSVLNILGWE
jgi:dsRNA-specific ribonuclease